MNPEPHEIDSDLEYRLSMDQFFTVVESEDVFAWCPTEELTNVLFGGDRPNTELQSMDYVRYISPDGTHLILETPPRTNKIRHLGTGNEEPAWNVVFPWLIGSVTIKTSIYAYDDLLTAITPENVQKVDYFFSNTGLEFEDSLLAPLPFPMETNTSLARMFTAPLSRVWSYRKRDIPDDLSSLPADIAPNDPNSDIETVLRHWSKLDVGLVIDVDWHADLKIEDLIDRNLKASSDADNLAEWLIDLIKVANPDSWDDIDYYAELREEFGEDIEQFETNVPTTQIKSDASDSLARLRAAVVAEKYETPDVDVDKLEESIFDRVQTATQKTNPADVLTVTDHLTDAGRPVFWTATSGTLRFGHVENVDPATGMTVKRPVIAEQSEFTEEAEIEEHGPDNDEEEGL